MNLHERERERKKSNALAKWRSNSRGIEPVAGEDTGWPEQRRRRRPIMIVERERSILIAMLARSPRAKFVLFFFVGWYFSSHGRTGLLLLRRCGWSL